MTEDIPEVKIGNKESRFYGAKIAEFESDTIRLMARGRKISILFDAIENFKTISKKEVDVLSIKCGTVVVDADDRVRRITDLEVVVKVV